MNSFCWLLWVISSYLPNLCQWFLIPPKIIQKPEGILKSSWNQCNIGRIWVRGNWKGMLAKNVINILDINCKHDRPPCTKYHMQGNFFLEFCFILFNSLELWIWALTIAMKYQWDTKSFIKLPKKLNKGISNTLLLTIYPVIKPANFIVTEAT